MEPAVLTQAGIIASRREPETLHSYLELHGEQGPQLEDSGTEIGIVTNITGIQFFRLSYYGKACHAGTTPMSDRQDAALGAAAFTLDTRKLLQDTFPDCLMNIGQIHLEPGNFNIVPEKAGLNVEYRSPDPQQLNNLRNSIFQCAHVIAERFKLNLDIEELPGRMPTPMNLQIQKAIQHAVDEKHLSHMHLHSGPGHDAQALARVIPSGVIFVPSIGGISHSPDEYTPSEACVNGANVLLHTALQIASTPKSELLPENSDLSGSEPLILPMSVPVLPGIDLHIDYDKNLSGPTTPDVCLVQSLGRHQSPKPGQRP
jgi:beta-ureidopropionase / N-carbamoyl-L-amino-acid hydrolase